MRRPPSRFEIVAASACMWITLVLVLAGLLLSWSEVARAQTFGAMWAALYLRKSVELRTHRWLLDRALLATSEEKR